jgi:tRNA 2-thiocytidine biosynthesis protein TtcA
MPVVNSLQTPAVFYPETLAQMDVEEDIFSQDDIKGNIQDIAQGMAQESSATSKTAVDELDKKHRTEFNKLQKRLRRLVGTAITDFNMIEEGDKVMVCVSGGKDSYTMLEILLNLQVSAPIKFDIVAVNMDQKQPGFPEHVLPEYLTKRGVPFYILEKDTYTIVKQLTPEGKTFCAVCSRLRRGNLYAFAQEIGATKVALGHHRDDILATLFLNMFHGGKLKAMPPKLLSDDKKNILIRPLAYCKEKDIAEFARLKGFPIIPCNLCGSQENLQRAAINTMLREWDVKFPQRLDSMFTAVQNVAPSQLADRELFDFISLQTEAADDSPADGSRLDVVNLSL